MSEQSRLKRYTKSTLPTKICVGCGKPMAWRKRWEKVWDTVKYCSERCRRNKLVANKHSDIDVSSD